MILLDTHTWIWWVTRDERLSRAARRAMESETALGVSPVSCFEVARLAARGRIRLDRAPELWTAQALAQPGIELVEVTSGVATRAALLDPFHGDPIDRILAQSAIELRVPLVTKDERIRTSALVRTIW